MRVVSASAKSLEICPLRASSPLFLSKFIASPAPNPSKFKQRRIITSHYPYPNSNYSRSNCTKSWIINSPKPKSKSNGAPSTSRIGRVKCEERTSQSPPPAAALGPQDEDNDDDKGSSSGSTYQGVYGPWTIDDADVQEVVLYRGGLVTAAASFVTAASTAFLPPDLPFTAALHHYLDLFYVLGAAALGLSLYLIHIYVTEIKRTLQFLWALGVVGSVSAYTFLLPPSPHHTHMIGLVDYVALHNPAAVWLVGPLFSALTGLVFKEGLCYGKLEAGILTFVIPSILLGHLTGLMDDGVKLSLLGVWMVLFFIFAARKFTQPIKDDIGDKSVFMFNALKEEEKKALLQKLELQNFSPRRN